MKDLRTQLYESLKNWLDPVHVILRSGSIIQLDNKADILKEATNDYGEHIGWSTTVHNLFESYDVNLISKYTKDDDMMRAFKIHNGVEHLLWDRDGNYEQDNK